MKRLLFHIATTICSVGYAVNAMAGEWLVVVDTPVLALVQSRTSSNSPLAIQTSQPLSPSCPHNRLYVDFNDKELIATLLQASATGQRVNIGYSTENYPSVHIAFHGVYNCKVESIW